jgi:MFS family permease
MTVVAERSVGAIPSPSTASLNGLDGVNFFVAGMSAGFGPYVAVYLADQKWTQLDIGFVLTAGGLAGLLSQLPGGELVDTLRSKRAFVAVGAVAVAISAVIIDIRPTLPFVFIGLVLQGITGGFVGPAIAAISLGLVGHSGLPERLGRNQRLASIGGLAVAALMGLTAFFVSYQAIFAMVAALVLPTLVMLARIRPIEIHFGRSCGAPDHHTVDQPARASRRALWKIPELLIFATSLFLFELANASVLPLVGETLVYQGESRSSLIVSVLIILPQIVVAVMAPWVGRQARSWGRRPLLLIGFSALPVRALLFAVTTDPQLLVVSVARWREWSGGGRSYGAGHCRCHERNWSIQPRSRHDRDRVGTRRFAWHCTLRSGGREFRPYDCISEYRIGGSARRIDAWILNAGDEAGRREVI